MGFFDKVLSKVGAALATRYGLVVGGQYAGCKIALGNPPTEKVSVANSFSQIIFLHENEEIARYNIREIINIEFLETITFPESGSKGYRCTITLPAGGTCDVDLYQSTISVFYDNTCTRMLPETIVFFKQELT